ncbi:hypothetical protein [Pseudomonas simiae]|uniref:Uncharacterized protein n=1 Tax=Pseudomonas simiae TaxID=321846 RepID=U1SQI8_9PSED|nr:hypothetical protein [Pseudomonas simiae]ERH48516.1 hypothetical protein O204_11740 [Pseudomonas simiae]
MSARTDACGQSQTRRARAATDVKHAFAGGGRRGFYRGLAKYRKHGVEPGLIGGPVLSTFAIPIGDLIGFLLCHDISSFCFVLNS